MEEPASAEKPAKSLARRWLLRVGAAVLLLAAFTWLAVWLTERTYKSSNKKRNLQSWLEDNLNADVSLLGDMIVRLNLVRPSRLVLRNVEVDHPNIIFSGKFITAGEIAARTPPWSVFHLWKSRLELAGSRINLHIEENETGEWNLAGLMNPLVAANARFPFPVPKFDRWRLSLRDSLLTLRRRNRELQFHIDGNLYGNTTNRRIAVRADNVPFTYRVDEDATPLSGSAGPVAASIRIDKTRGSSPELAPLDFDIKVQELPISMLPFFFSGVPLDGAPGRFGGTFKLRESIPGGYEAGVTGTVRDVPLAVFGLPNQTAVEANWPLGKALVDGEARVHLGPHGFGGFEMRVPLDSLGRPRMLAMRGDVASLDDLPSLVSSQTRWLDWLSRSFPAIEWRSGRWVGFGWNGSDLNLSLTRNAAGLNLMGEAELLNGRIRLAMTPGQRISPVIIAAERVDAQLLGVKLAQLLPEAYRAHIAGDHANLTWRGVPAGNGNDMESWTLVLVFAKPMLEPARAGQWWRGLSGLPLAIADALPGWGGGDPALLEQVAQGGTVQLEQLSIVAEKTASGHIRVEFVTYGGDFGEAGGWFEVRPGRPVSGELYLTGESPVLHATEQANPELGRALRMLANQSLGLRVTFQSVEAGEAVFDFPFLEDAEKIRQSLAADQP